MDSEIALALNQLQERKYALETGTELRDKCSVIFELNQRVVSLLDEIHKLQAEVNGILGLEDKWDKLGQPYLVLVRTSHALDMLIGLSKLNKICRRIDSNPNLEHSKNGEKITIKLRRMASNKLSEIDDPIDKIDPEDMPTILQVLDLLDDFESNYEPLEKVLSIREDLPYLKYSKKIRRLKCATEKFRRLRGHNTW